MDPKELDAYRQALVAQKNEIEHLTSDSAGDADTVVLDQSKVGRLSRMDALQAQQMARETVRRRQQQLLKIDAALRRMEEGDFGYCFLCGEEIGDARLGFDPASTRCIGCMHN